MRPFLKGHVANCTIHFHPLVYGDLPPVKCTYKYTVQCVYIYIQHYTQQGVCSKLNKHGSHAFPPTPQCQMAIGTNCQVPSKEHAPVSDICWAPVNAWMPCERVWMPNPAQSTVSSNGTISSNGNRGSAH